MENHFRSKGDTMPGTGAGTFIDSKIQYFRKTNSG